MSTDASPSSKLRPGFEAFGLELELRLTELGAIGHKVGTSERISAWMLAHELFQLGAVTTIQDMEPYLSAVIAKAPEQSFSFEPRSAPSSWHHGSQAVEPVSLSERSPRAARKALLIRSLIAVALVVMAFWFFDVMNVGPTLVPIDNQPTQARDSSSQFQSSSRSQRTEKDDPTSVLEGRVEHVLGAVWSTGGNTSIANLAHQLDLDGSDENNSQRSQALSAILNLAPYQTIELCGTADAVVQRLAAIVNAVLLIEGTQSAAGFTVIEAVIRDKGVPVCAPGYNHHMVQSSAISAWQVLILLPILLTSVFVYLKLRRERAHLRRTRPESTPIRTSYISNVLRGRNFWAEDDRRLMRLLLARDQSESPAIDVARTISETIRAGGRFLRIARQRLKPTPEYLVLIERNRMGDLTAARMRDLLRPFERDGHLHFDLYYYKDLPTFVTAETDGLPVPLEAVRARFPDHRLVILGTGRRFVDPITGRESAIAATLRRWRRRALLTPVPLSEWSSSEFAVARALDAPIARATRSGLYSLPDLLALEGAALPSVPHGHGDGSQVALPDNLRLRPLNLMMDDEPSDYPTERVVAELREVLDRDGFRWLAALAVYPALQWDLTLFLGLELRAYRGDERGDLRLATLTRLPWLQYGYMPVWLRLALIEELSERDGSRIYVRIVEALKEANQKTSNNDDRLVLNVGQERMHDPLVGTDDNPIEDQVLVKFLSRGDAGDLPLPKNWRSPAREHRRAFLRRFSTWRPIMLATLLSAGLAMTSPTPAEAPVTGAWISMIVLTFGAIGLLAAETLIIRLSGGRSDAKKSDKIYKQLHLNKNQRKDARSFKPGWFDQKLRREQPGSIADNLVALAEVAPGGTVTLGWVLDQLHERSFGLFLLVLALPCCIPFLYGIPQIVSLPLMFVAAQIVTGRDVPWLPNKLRRRQITVSGLADLATRARPWLKRIEALSRPRLAALTWRPLSQIVGLALLLFGASIMVPLPGTNTVPGFAVVLVSMGLLQRDGILVIVGSVIGTVWIATLIIAGATVATLLKAWLGL